MGELKWHEKMRAKGCEVNAPKPVWLLREQQKIKEEWKQKLFGWE